MRHTLKSLLLLFVLVGSSSAKEIPPAPSSVARPAESAAGFTTRESSSKPLDFRTAEARPTIDKRFVALSVISTGSTFADSYTTLFARQNWLAGKKGVCNAEVQSAYLYGTHPDVGRAYGVAVAKSVGTVAASYYLRKHHSKLWALPLLANSVISLQGTSQNLVACN